MKQSLHSTRLWWEKLLCSHSITQNTAQNEDIFQMHCLCIVLSKPEPDTSALHNFQYRKASKEIWVHFNNLTGKGTVYVQVTWRIHCLQQKRTFLPCHPKPCCKPIAELKDSGSYNVFGSIICLFTRKFPWLSQHYFLIWINPHLFKARLM
jgi:hypothetical protein